MEEVSQAETTVDGVARSAETQADRARTLAISAEWADAIGKVGFKTVSGRHIVRCDKAPNLEQVVLRYRRKAVGPHPR